MAQTQKINPHGHCMTAQRSKPLMEAKMAQSKWYLSYPDGEAHGSHVRSSAWDRKEPLHEGYMTSSPHRSTSSSQWDQYWSQPWHPSLCELPVQGAMLELRCWRERPLLAAFSTHTAFERPSSPALGRQKQGKLCDFEATSSTQWVPGQGHMRPAEVFREQDGWRVLIDSAEFQVTDGTLWAPRMEGDTTQGQPSLGATNHKWKRTPLVFQSFEYSDSLLRNQSFHRIKILLF